MKRFICSLLVLSLPMQALADITVTFSYTEASNATITGFRLMRDGVMECDNIAPELRTFNCKSPPDDQKDHSYTLVAVGKYGQLAESTPYVFKWVAPTIPKPTYLKVR